MKFLLVWKCKQPEKHIKYVLEALDWDKLYDFHQHQMEVTRDQFYGFVSYCVIHDVHQARFLNSSLRLLQRNNVDFNLEVLSVLSSKYFPSRFAYIFFKAISRPAELDSTVAKMYKIVTNTDMRGRVK